MNQLKLTGPRGDNPLGFLTALGVLAALDDAGVEGALRWEGLAPWLRFLPPQPCGGREVAATAAPDSAGEPKEWSDPSDLLLDTLLRALQRNRPSDSAKKCLVAADRAMTAIKTQRKKISDAIKKRGLGRAERKEALAREVEPLDKKYLLARQQYLAALQQASVDPALALGKNLAATNAEYRSFLDSLLSLPPGRSQRNLDLAAAYGVSDPNAPGEAIQPTPWALITGAGHQHFLETVAELILNCRADHIRQALFGPWIARDEKFSLRLDPAEDRRYALMAADPTASDNKTLTLWGANRLAFESLRFFTCYPAIRTGMAVLAWRPASSRGYRSGAEVRWPLWQSWLTAGEIRSILALPDIWEDSAEARSALRARGIHGVMRSRRIEVKKYFNLLPGAPVWFSPKG